MIATASTDVVHGLGGPPGFAIVIVVVTGLTAGGVVRSWLGRRGGREGIGVTGWGPMVGGVRLPERREKGVVNTSKST